MFYDRYAELCAEKGISPSKAAEENGLSRMTVSRWRQGATPNADILASLSSYFKVSTDYLLGVDSLADRLKSILADRQMTIRELSEITELPSNYIFGIIKGRRDPSLKNLEKISQCLSVSLGYLLGTENAEKEKTPAPAKEDELSKIIFADERKAKFVEWIAGLDDRSLDRIEKLLDAVEMLPKE